MGPLDRQHDIPFTLLERQISGPVQTSYIGSSGKEDQAHLFSQPPGNLDPGPESPLVNDTGCL